MFHQKIHKLILIFIFLVIGISYSHSAPKGKGEPNDRMENSSSPYLKSHSRDLVRWYEWGPEAFSKALSENKPLIVSFGYTACHWCHVMQEKHFNNVDIAKQINASFVPVLVDRERRTSLDDTYMLVTEILTRRGGWPNTVFLTPQLKPFYGTAYIPPREFTSLLNEAENNWVNNNAAILNESHRVSSILTRYLTRREKAQEITPEILLKAAQSFVPQFDSFYGGMGNAPKFFRPTVLMFMLNQYERSGNTDILEVIEKTLKSVALGGIHDHIEGGFHRYAVDPKWRIPHFEKMLNDQALMAEIYLKAYEITGKEDYKRTAKKTLNYIITDLTSQTGGFYTARDADSEGEEGTYYVWTPEELEKALGKQDANFATELFEIVNEGEFAGKVILNKDNLGASDAKRAEKILRELSRIRSSRPKPIRDEKVLVSWNSMAIQAFAKASSILQDKKYQEVAVKAADFIWVKMRSDDGFLFRSYFKGKATIDAELEDYALLANSFLTLFDITKNRMWLDRSLDLAKVIREHFEDKKHGDFYGTRHAEGFLRAKPRNDVDQPSGNGAALQFFARLTKRSERPEHRHNLEKSISELSGIALSSPAGSASMLNAIDLFLRGENASVQYAGNGVARVEMMPIEGDQVKLNIIMKAGWHINSNIPLEKDFIATKLQLVQNGEDVQSKITYPDAKIKKLSFNKKDISLYEDNVQIIAQPGVGNFPDLKARIELQACSDKICLLPEILEFRIR